MAQTETDLLQRGINIFQFKEYVPNAIMMPSPNDWDWTEALRQAITYCRDNNINKIIAPQGIYRILNDIDLSTVPLLEIEGVTNGQLYPGSGAKTRFSFENCITGFALGRNPYVTLKNLELDGTNTTNIVLDFGYFTRLINVSVSGGLLTGGKITTGQNGLYVSCSFSGNGGDGLQLEDTMTTTQTFFNCFFRENQGKGISGVTSDCYFLRCTFESNFGKGIHITEGYKLIKFESCYWEANEMPNGFHLQLENGEYQFDNCDFGSTQIVRVANLINAKAEFRKSKHEGGIDTPPVEFDTTSKLILVDSFEGYPVSNRAIIPKFKNELIGSASWLLFNSPNTIRIDFGKTLPIANYQVFLTVDCTENIGYTISGRSESGFTINIHQKPTGENANILWKVEY